MAWHPVSWNGPPEIFISSLNTEPRFHAACIVMILMPLDLNVLGTLSKDRGLHVICISVIVKTVLSQFSICVTLLCSLHFMTSKLCCFGGKIWIFILHFCDINNGGRRSFNTNSSGGTILFHSCTCYPILFGQLSRNDIESESGEICVSKIWSKSTI